MDNTQIDYEIQGYNAKHRRLRGGSLDYKYPPMVAACKTECGLGDESVPRRDGKGHRCVLAIGHSGEHEWSSECRGMDWRWGR